MTINQLKEELLKEIIKAGTKLAQVQDLEGVEHCVRLSDHLESGIGEPAKEKTPEKEVKPKTKVVKPAVETEKELPQVEDIDGFDIEKAVEYTLNNAQLSKEEMDWLDEGAMCQAGDITKALWDVTPANLRYHLNSNNLRGIKTEGRYAYFRYSILLVKSLGKDPWGGLIE